MSTRLPTPGGDNGDWGDILNAYLDVSHNSDGTLANSTVGTNQLQNNAVTNAQLDSPTQSAITLANSSVQSVNSITPTSGNVAITAGSINAVATSQLGAASGVATLDSSSQLTSSQIPSSVVSVSSPASGGVAQFTGTNWVTANAVMQGSQIYSVMDSAYGAHGNAARIVDGAMTSGNSTLTTASASSFKAGMTVFVAGAGTSGVALRTTVSTNGSGTTVMLSANAVTTVSGAQVDYGTPDNTPIQAAINAASAAGGGTVFFPEANYLIDIDATYGNGWQSYTPTGNIAYHYGVSIPSNITIRMAGGAVIRAPFNGTGFDPSCCPIAIAPNATFVDLQVDMDGCAISGGNVENNHHAILILDPASDITIRDFNVHNFYGKAVGAFGSNGYNRLKLLNGNAYEINSQLATMDYVNYAWVIDCTCHDNIGGGAEALILGGTSHIYVRGLEVYNQGTAVSMTGNATGTISDITITDCHFLDPIQVSGAITDAIISNNVIDISAQASGQALYLSGSGTSTFTRLSIVNNHFLGNSSVNAIIIEPALASTDLNFSNNIVTGSIQTIIANNITSGEVTNNIFDGNALSVGNGIDIVSNNKIYNASLTAGTTSATIANNTVYGPAASSVYAFSLTGNKNTVTGNSVIGNQTDNSSASFRTSAATNNIIVGNYIYATNTGSRCLWDGQSSAGTNFYISNYLYAAGGAPVNQAAVTSVLRNNAGYNPVGNVTVSVPSSGTDVSSTFYDRTFYVTAAASGTTTMTVTSVGSSSTITVPASTAMPIFVPATYTLTPSYASAPTWVVYAQ